MHPTSSGAYEPVANMKYQPGKVQVRLHLYTVTTAHKAKTSKIVLQTSSHIRILWVFPSNSYFHRHWASQKISKETFCLGRSPFREQKPWENHQTCTGGSGQNRYTCHCFKKMWHVSFLPPQNVQSFAVFLGPVKPGRNPPLKPVDTTNFYDKVCASWRNKFNLRSNLGGAII